MVKGLTVLGFRKILLDEIASASLHSVAFLTSNSLQIFVGFISCLKIRLMLFCYLSLYFQFQKSHISSICGMDIYFKKEFLHTTGR